MQIGAASEIFYIALVGAGVCRGVSPNVWILYEKCK